MHREYAKPEMKKSVKTLWDFWRICKVENKKGEIDEEKTGMNLKKYYDPDVDISIDNARRHVIFFYHHMGNIYFNDILGDHEKEKTKKLFFVFWDIDTLRIIKWILIPLEKKLLNA